MAGRTRRPDSEPREAQAARPWPGMAPAPIDLRSGGARTKNLAPPRQAALGVHRDESPSEHCGPRPQRPPNPAQDWFPACDELLMIVTFSPGGTGPWGEDMLIHRAKRRRDGLSATSRDIPRSERRPTLSGLLKSANRERTSGTCSCARHVVLTGVSARRVADTRAGNDVAFRNRYLRVLRVL